GIAGRDFLCQSSDLGREDLFGGDDPIEPAELAGVIARRGAREQETVDETSGEADADADARAGVRVQVARDQVVELPVEVRNRQQRENPRDRIDLGGVEISSHPGPIGIYRPAAARSLSARSVFSHGRSMSVRPKWPYAAVCA